MLLAKGSPRAGRCGLRRYGLDVLDDGADLRGLEIIAEARHARRAVADVFADQLFVAAQGLARQYRSVLPRSLLDHSVADAAGLAEKAQSFALGIVERRIGRALRKRPRCRCNHECRSQNPSWHLPILRLFAAAPIFLHGAAASRGAGAGA